MSTAIIRCFNHFSEVKKWSPQTWRLESDAIVQGWQGIGGVFAGTSNRWTAIVRYQDELIIARPGEERPLSSVELVEIVPATSGGKEVQLRFGDGVIWSFEYSPLTPALDENDLTPFVAQEDFDFGEYVRSLVLDIDRQGRVFRGGEP